MSMALRRHLLGGANLITALLKPRIRYWAPLNHNALIPTCSSPSSTFLHRYYAVALAFTKVPTRMIGSSNSHNLQYNNIISKSTHLRYVRVVGASHTSASSMFYHITLEALSVNRTKMYHVIVWMQIFKNFMELLVWMPVSDNLWTLGVKYGDLRLHEAVMLYMNQAKQDRFLT